MGCRLLGRGTDSWTQFAGLRRLGGTVIRHAFLSPFPIVLGAPTAVAESRIRALELASDRDEADRARGLCACFRTIPITPVASRAKEEATAAWRVRANDEAEGRHPGNSAEEPRHRQCSASDVAETACSWSGVTHWDGALSPEGFHEEPAESRAMPRCRDPQLHVASATVNVRRWIRKIAKKDVPQLNRCANLS